MGLPHYEWLTMVNIFFVLVERVSCCRSTSIITLLHGRNGPCHRTMELRSWNTLSKASKLQNFDFVLWKHIIFGYVWCPWALSDMDVCPIPFLIWHSASPIILGVLLVARTMDTNPVTFRGPSWNSQQWPSLPLRHVDGAQWHFCWLSSIFIMFSTDFPGIYHLVASLEIGLVKAFPPDILLPLRLHFSSGGIDGIIAFFFNYVARSLRLWQSLRPKSAIARNHKNRVGRHIRHCSLWPAWSFRRLCTEGQSQGSQRFFQRLDTQFAAIAWELLAFTENYLELPLQSCKQSLALFLRLLCINPGTSLSSFFVSVHSVSLCQFSCPHQFWNPGCTDLVWVGEFSSSRKARHFCTEFISEKSMNSSSGAAMADKNGEKMRENGLIVLNRPWTDGTCNLEGWNSLITSLCMQLGATVADMVCKLEVSTCFPSASLTRKQTKDFFFWLSESLHLCFDWSNHSFKCMLQFFIFVTWLTWGHFPFRDIFHGHVHQRDGNSRWGGSQLFRWQRTTRRRESELSMPKADEKHSMAMGNLCPKSSQQVRMQLPTKGPTLRDESVMNFVSFADGICTFVKMFFRWSLFASLYMMFITSSKVGRSLEESDTSTHQFFAIDGVAGFGDLHPRPGILRGHSLHREY